MDRKKIMWSVIAAAIAILCVVLVVKSSQSFDFAELLTDLKKAKKIYLAGAFAGTAGFIFWEGMAIRVIANGLSKASVKGIGLVYSTSDVYFSAITPSATGGQPMSLYFMVKDGMTVSLASIVLLLNLVMYSVALMVIGLFCILLNPQIVLGLPGVAKLLVIVGYAVTVVLGCVFWLLIFREKIIYRIAMWGIRVLHRLHLMKDPAHYEEKLQHTMEEYKQCANSIKGKYRMLILGFLCNLLQRASQVSVTAFCYLAIGGSAHKFLRLFCVQGIAAVGSNSVPIPGAMGAADYLLLNGLKAIQAVNHVANLELLSRGISFYFCIIFCGIYTAAAYIYRKRKQN